MTDLSALTPLELEAIQAYLDHGSHKAAAGALGVPEATLRSRISRAIRASGAKNIAQLTYELGLERCRIAA